MSTKRVPRSLAVAAAIPLLFAACSSGATPSPAASSAPSAAASAGGSAAPSSAAMDTLIAAAQKEGSLNVIALPHTWCNYGSLLSDFKAKYGLSINEINPNGGSGDEINAIVANKTNTGPGAPDVIDVGISFGPKAVAQGLVAPYKVSTWDTIPVGEKDPNGYWYGDYYGVLAFEVNTAVVKNVPQDWSDLLKPEYAHSVALAGDPTVAAQATDAVYAAALANGGSLDNAQPGLDFFKNLNAAGNFVPTIAGAATLASGETPIVITWSYLALADRDRLNGNPPVTVVVPKSGRFGGLYVQAISAYAPHPNAAKLWEEYLYSDAGQLGWMTGYCYPIRYADLLARNVVPASITAKLPDVTGAVFPSQAQGVAATTLITSEWKSQVGVTVK